MSYTSPSPIDAKGLRFVLRGEGESFGYRDER